MKIKLKIYLFTFIANTNEQNFLKTSIFMQTKLPM